MRPISIRLRPHPALLVLLACLFAASPYAQTLARPGWAGSGMTVEPWWTHAVFYEIDPHGFHASANGSTGDLHGLATQLDYIRSLGVDAIALTHLGLAQGEPAARFQSIDPALGTLEDFDEVLREAARDNLRLLVEIDPEQLAEPAALASAGRFWLTRGAGGISLRPTSSGTSRNAQQRTAQLHALREVARSFPGQRIVVDQNANHSEAADLTLNPALSVPTALDAAQLHPILAQLSGETPAPLSMTDAVGLPRSASRFSAGSASADPATSLAINKLLAAFLLTTHANAQLLFGQEIGMRDQDTLMAWGTPADPAAKKKPAPTPGPEVAAEEADGSSLLNWYRRLIDLHHGNPALRSGTSDFLNHDSENALVWVSRKGAATPLSPAIVIACNLSAKPITLNLEKDMLGLHLRGNFLRTIVRSSEGMGGQSLNAVTLPAYGVYIGELRL